MNKFFVIILYLIIHFLVLSHIRNTVFSWQLGKGFIDKIEETDYISIRTLDTRLVYFDFHSENLSKTIHYKISFGFFFLIAIVFLILLGAGKKFFIFIVCAHFFDLILSSLLILISPTLGFGLLLICDLMSRYIIPLVSIGVIPMVIFFKKALNN